MVNHEKKHSKKKRSSKEFKANSTEAREYLAGKLRKGVIIDGKERAVFIAAIKAQLPGYVEQVLLRADDEILSWLSVQAAIAARFQFFIANIEDVIPRGAEKLWSIKKLKILIFDFFLDKLNIVQHYDNV